MSKFKVGDKVLFGNQVVEITQIFDSGKCMVSNGWLQNSAWIDDLESYKTAHERLVELGWGLTHEDENVIIYHKSYAKSLSFHKKHANCFTDERNIDLQFAEVLVDYLKEL